MKGLTCASTYGFKVRCKERLRRRLRLQQRRLRVDDELAATPEPTGCLAERIGNTPQPDAIQVRWSYSGPPVSGFREARLDPGESDEPAYWDNFGGDRPPPTNVTIDTKTLVNGKIRNYQVRALPVTPCGRIYSPYSNVDADKP